MSTTNQQKRDSRRGNAVVELGIAVPVLIGMVFGAVDFGRMFFEATVTQNAAEVGSLYGSQSMKFVGDRYGIMNAARQEAADVQGSSPSVEVICQCPTSMSNFGDGQTISCTTECDNGYGAPRVYVRTRVAKDFRTFGWYPGVPQSVDLNMDGWVRVQ